MRFVPFVMLLGLLYGCAAREVITFDIPPQKSTLMVVDERPDIERNYGGCRDHGYGWYGVSDEAFKTSRVELLRARLHAALGDKIKNVQVRHFQNCFQRNSSSGAAAFAGISYVLALAIDAAHKRGDDLLMTYIDISVDGHPVIAADLRSIKSDQLWAGLSRQKPTIDLIVQSSEAAITQAIANIRDRIK